MRRDDNGVMREWGLTALQKVPVIGQRFIRDIPASDNVRAIPSCVVGEICMTRDANCGTAFLIDLLDWDGGVKGVEGDERGAKGDIGRCLESVY